MQNDIVIGLRLRLVEQLVKMEQAGNSELLESRLAKLDFSPKELRSFFNGTDDNLRVGQLRDLADALSLDLVLTVVNRRRPGEQTRHPIPATSPPDGPVGSMPAGAVFARRSTDIVTGAALPSPLAPPALDDARDQPVGLLTAQEQSDHLPAAE
jgi:hypothetical protein